MDTLKYENEINCSEYFTFFFLSRCFFFQIIIRIQKFIKFKNGYESFVNVWLIERRNIMKMLILHKYQKALGQCTFHYNLLRTCL